MINHHFEQTDISIKKVLELYETHNSRHSVMLVGQTLSGKTTTWKLFKYALNTLNKQGFNEYNKIIVKRIFVWIDFSKNLIKFRNIQLIQKP